MAISNHAMPVDLLADHAALADVVFAIGDRLSLKPDMLRLMKAMFYVQAASVALAELAEGTTCSFKVRFEKLQHGPVCSQEMNSWQDHVDLPVHEPLRVNPNRIERGNTLLAFLSSCTVALLSLLVGRFLILPNNDVIETSQHEPPWKEAHYLQPLSFDYYRQTAGIQRILHFASESLSNRQPQPAESLRVLRFFCANKAVAEPNSPHVSLLVGIAGNEAVESCLFDSDVVHWPGQAPLGALRNATEEAKAFLQPFHAIDVKFLTDAPWFSQHALCYHSISDRQQLAEAAANGDWAAQYAVLDCTRHFDLETKVSTKLPCLVG
jgi:hypothetical protein